MGRFEGSGVVRDTPLEDQEVDRSYGVINVKTLVDYVKGKPINTVRVSTIVSILDDNYWYTDIDEATARSVAHHAIRIARADLANPIIMIRKDRDVLDGVHRLAKAYLGERRTIKVIYITRREARSLAV